MITLRGRVTRIDDPGGVLGRRVLRVTKNPSEDAFSRSESALLLQDTDGEPGFAAYLALDGSPVASPAKGSPSPLVVLPLAYEYLDRGDLVSFAPEQKKIRVLYRRASMQNYFLTTERCNHYCLMCSQPPKDIDDGWLADEILEAIPLIDPATEELGFTGGEPTLLGNRFIEILQSCKRHLPNTVLHVLSNGRTFAEPSFARKWADVAHPDLMVGIPIYSDVASLHDYVVQADGAFDETIRGILNLKRLRQQVEVRVVLHKQTYGRLPELAEFIARNLLFVDHVALMGLEITGFTRANLDSLWIDPIDYQEQLQEAVRILDRYRMRVSIYNHQLCLLKPELWKFAVKAISDWKNEYFEECKDCEVREECGGFFHSATLKKSKNIRPVRLPERGSLEVASVR